MSRRKKDNVLRPFKPRKLLRTHIGAGEAWVGLLCLVLIVGMTTWLWAQKDNYDPGERDISIKVLEEQSVPDTLYETPLKRWQDPAAATAGPAAVDLGPFPPSLLDGGWRTASRVQTFTPDNVYEKINGQEVQYKAFGFRSLTCLTLEHPADGIQVDLYLFDQGSFRNCLGLYEEQRGDKDVATLGPVHYTPTSVGAIGMVGHHFFHVIAAKESPAVATRTRGFLESFSAFAAAQQVPAPFKTLHEGLGIPFGAIGYTPQNVFSYDFAKDFWFGRPDPKVDTRYFVHVAKSEEEAKTLFEKMHVEQQEEFDVLESSAEAALYRHRFLKSFFALHRDGTLVFGIDNHPKRDEVAPASARLKEALQQPAPAGDDPGSDPGEDDYTGESGEY